VAVALRVLASLGIEAVEAATISATSAAGNTPRTMHSRRRGTAHVIARQGYGIVNAHSVEAVRKFRLPNEGIGTADERSTSPCHRGL